ncbi:MAG: IS66 family insertion sequence element accessory protein TnpB [Lachnospiraceae bacterium]|nr:IS66 family insertion sequence element accessory protein TnpB [Lachnospiraceae bacterium]
MLRNADPNSFAAVYVVCGYTDMRYGIDTLAAIIESRYHLSLFVPDTLFLFCGKRANKIKGLLWETDGFLLLTKRVEVGHFTWPRNSREARQLTPEQFRWLMNGFAIDPVIKPSYPERSA